MIKNSFCRLEYARYEKIFFPKRAEQFFGEDFVIRTHSFGSTRKKYHDE